MRNRPVNPFLVCGEGPLEQLLQIRRRQPDDPVGPAIIEVNRPVDEPLAQAIASTFIEAVIAPSIDDAAALVLATKPNMRVVTADFDALSGQAGEELRTILGGVLALEPVEVGRRQVIGEHRVRRDRADHVVLHRDGHHDAARHRAHRRRPRPPVDALHPALDLRHLAGADHGARRGRGVA